MTNPNQPDFNPWGNPWGDTADQSKQRDQSGPQGPNGQSDPTAEQKTEDTPIFGAVVYAETDVPSYWMRRRRTMLYIIVVMMVIIMVSLYIWLT